MSTRIFKGYTIEDASYQDTDAPGYWFPRVFVESATIERTSVVLPMAHGIDEATDDDEAHSVARTRILSNNL